jgi:mycothiol synthase
MMIIRAAGPEDMAGIQRICETAFDLEPDAGALPGTLTRDRDHLGFVAEDGGDVVGVCFGSLGRIAVDGPRRGHVDLLAVGGEARGRGTGMRLLAAMESLLREKGAAVALLAGNPPVYAWPGVDARYTVMTCLAERAGYQKYRDAVDMAVSLRGVDLDTRAAQERLGAAGIEVRRVAAAEAGLVVGWLRQGPWGTSGWPDEVASALAGGKLAGGKLAGGKLAREAGQPWTAGCHVACRDDRYVGFASHGAMRRGWFGPMGTDAVERQHGIGTVLLKRCLADMAAAGLDTARIGWVGPVSFYARVLGARVERVYWLYRKALLSTCPSMVACSPGSTARSRPTGSAAGWIAAWRACCCSRATSPARTS